MNEITTLKERIKTGWILVSISSMLTVSVIYWYINNPKRFIENGLGYSSEMLLNLPMWFFTLLIVIGYISYTMIAIPYVKRNLLTFSWLKLIGIWAAIVSGIVEEVVFRHLLMDYVLSIGLSNFSQMLISGIAFGIAHGAWVLLRGEIKIALPAILSTTILGCLLAMLYIYTGRSTFAPIIAHILINMVIEPWLMLSAISGKWKINKSLK
ncbi:CAAX protease family protein [Viridibacillus sp. FSL H7-0596]|uniref:CPBP family intramembrane glutamic endopeptidase n=1 Tax=unclassified Viridibacillus TaxID=2617942 RepID=UPI00096C40DD|nr:CPBP family intramembrane glutamic endopeptidase [Viridibacillus sp. FSL H7-0596]OMC86518.1 CAAX protease family protein [Viridibacillus sp. FSL H7-0596]